MKPKTMNLIIKAVDRAREKHPNFAFIPACAVSIAAEELGEFAKEVNDGEPERADEEALDLIAVLVRWLERDK